MNAVTQREGTTVDMVNAATKTEILDEILADDGAGLLYGWDGTFSDLHRFVDANEYIQGVYASFLPNHDAAVAACNEVTDWLDAAFAKLGA